MELTAEVARDLLRYEPETGKLYWKERDAKWFKEENQSEDWNRRYAGEKTGESKSKDGYNQICLLNTHYKKHRVIWLIEYGLWPKGQIDHINGDKCDNRLENLRQVSPSENSRNVRITRRNKSGVVGVHWDKYMGKWCAVIMNGGKNVRVGSFTDFDKAVKARRKAEVEYGYHPNHGTERKQDAN